jgi:Cu/Ag efflux protein CusF
MKKNLICAAILLAALATPVMAATSEGVVLAAQPGATTLAEAVKTTVTITAIDAPTRKVTVTNAAGKSFSITAGENVKNFAALKVGDKIQAEYLQVLNLELIQSGDKIRKRVVETDAVPVKDAKAGAAVGEQITVVGNVLAVNAKNHTVRVQGVEHTVTLKVRDPAQFKLIKKGDQIKGVYTEALAVAVTAAN